MSTYRDRMAAVTQHLHQVIECATCGKAWQRPAGMAELRCPPCARLQGNGGLTTPTERIAASVTAYRLAIEEATAYLRQERPMDALRVLLRVEAPARAKAGRRDGLAKALEIARETRPAPDVRVQAPEPVKQPEQPAEQRDSDLVACIECGKWQTHRVCADCYRDSQASPLDLVANLASGAYKVELKGRRGSRR